MTQQSSRLSRRARRRSVILIVGALLTGVLSVAPSPLAADPGDDVRASVGFEPVRVNHVELGDLAVRTKGLDGPVTASGIGPFTVTGSDPNGAYSFVSDLPYGPDPLPFVSPHHHMVHNGWRVEGQERPLTSAGTFSSSEPAVGQLRLKSRGNCEGPGNQAPHCSVFGPEVYSNTFTIPADDPREWAVSFNWMASGIDDDYEIYGFLVKVNEFEGDYDYGQADPAASHTLLAYGRGRAQSWTTTSARVSEPGTYRFRFVNGSYDGTGGLLVGGEMTISNAIVMGLHNPISFPVVEDVVYDDEGDNTIELEATAPGGGPVEYSSVDEDVCTVAVATVTILKSGRCTIVADHPGDTDYVPAGSVTRSFTVLDEAEVPQNNGRPTFTVEEVGGTPNKLEGNPGTWSDRGSNITGTTYQWLLTEGGTTNPIPGATSATCTLVEKAGATLSLRVTVTNGVGETSSDSSQTLAGYTCQTAPAGGGGGGTAPPAEAVPVPTPPTAGASVPTVIATPRGNLTVTFEGVAPRAGSGSGDGTAGTLRVVANPADNGSDVWDRGVTAVTDRYALTAEDFTFTGAEVCIPYDPDAFSAQDRPEDRLRLLHTHDGVERDITTHLDTTSTPPMVCGNTEHFSDFQVVVYAGDRQAGDDRYGTAAQVARELYPSGASVVYVATGENHPDAVAAGLSAAMADAPLLLVRHNSVPASTSAALGALRPDRIVVVGGTAAVSDSVMASLGSGGAAVTRVAGANRYATAAALAAEAFPAGTDTVYLMTGRQFADALTGGPVAYGAGAAILLTEPSALTPVTAQAIRELGPNRVVVIGGTAAISAEVEAAVAALVPHVERIGGSDRYHTSALLAQGRSGGALVAATGQNFADALVATTVAVKRSGPIVLVAGNDVPQTIRNAVRSIAPKSLVVVGGQAATGAQAELTLIRLLPKTSPGPL